MSTVEKPLFEESLQRASQIGILGPSENNLPTDPELREKMLKDAELIGGLIAKSGGILITGGTDGVMEFSSKGAFEAGGITVGTPGRTRGESNTYIKVEMCTPIDVGDFLFAGIPSCDSIIVFPGGAGTLAEVALAYRLRRPMIIMEGYSSYYDNLVGKQLDISSGKLSFWGASSPEKAVKMASSLAKLSQSGKPLTIEENYEK